MSSRNLNLSLPQLLPLALCFGLLSVVLIPPSLCSQQRSSSSSSSSSTGQQAPAQESSSSSPHIASQPEPGGSSITLETSESLFDIAAGLNACGYDNDLAHSSPIRQEVRNEINDALTKSPAGREARDALCQYIREHTLADPGQNLAQYVSLALFVNPTPELTPTVGEAEMPPDSTQVVNILPLLRRFRDAIDLHTIWIEHRPEYESLVRAVHDPLSKMILSTNIYLRLPVSSYDGRRFLVLLEPMLAPSETNARIYGSSYIVVTSPTPGDPPQVRMADIRHTYLHYLVEPMIYSRASAMDHLLPLLKPVQAAPVDFIYKSDISALLTECLIKAIEVHTMDVGIPRPQRPSSGRQRNDLEHYTEEMIVYNRQAEVVRRKAVDRDMREGWILVEYFYDQLTQMEKDSVSLSDYVGPMVYGMDVDRERHHAEQIAFIPGAGSDFVRRVAPRPTGLELAELKLMKGDTAGAEDIATKALTDPKSNQGEAHYILARASLMDRQPEEAITHFNAALQSSKDPRTLAWCHIYLGRLYDVQSERKKAVAEYQAALTVRDGRPDTKEAAEKGLKQPFALPQRAPMPNETDDDTPIDPTGKAEKEAYRPNNQP